MIHLKSMDIPSAARNKTGYPFTLPIIRSWPGLEFDAPVTFLIGENGSGKSTVLEGLAAAIGLPAIGSSDTEDDNTLKPARVLAGSMKLSWNRKMHKGFFLRAEDFFGFVKRIATARTELKQIEADFEEEYKDKSDFSRVMALSSVRGSLAAYRNSYGEDFDANSHGEAFMSIFRGRMSSNGIYLLDEPETPLSPQNQLAFLRMLAEGVSTGSQFIIATHSPILMAFPDAGIHTFDTIPIRRIEYGDVPHVNLTRDFLNNTQQFLRHLFT